MPVDGVRVEGLQQLSRLLALAGKEARTELRHELQNLAEPVRRDVESIALVRIRRIGPKWWRMRLGVTQKFVYIAPKERGVKRRGPDPKRRPAFGTLMQEDVMEPVMRAQTSRIEAGIEGLFERLAEKWSA